MADGVAFMKPVPAACRQWHRQQCHAHEMKAGNDARAQQRTVDSVASGSSARRTAMQQKRRTAAPDHAAGQSPAHAATPATPSKVTVSFLSRCRRRDREPCQPGCRLPVQEQKNRFSSPFLRQRTRQAARRFSASATRDILRHAPPASPASPALSFATMDNDRAAALRVAAASRRHAMPLPLLPPPQPATYPGNAAMLCTVCFRLPANTSLLHAGHKLLPPAGFAAPTASQRAISETEIHRDTENGECRLPFPPMPRFCHQSTTRQPGQKSPGRFPAQLQRPPLAQREAGFFGKHAGQRGAARGAGVAAAAGPRNIIAGARPPRCRLSPRAETRARDGVTTRSSFTSPPCRLSSSPPRLVAFRRNDTNSFVGDAMFQPATPRRNVYVNTTVTHAAAPPSVCFRCKRTF